MSLADLASYLDAGAEEPADPYDLDAWLAEARTSVGGHHLCGFSCGAVSITMWRLSDDTGYSVCYAHSDDPSCDCWLTYLDAELGGRVQAERRARNYFNNAWAEVCARQGIAVQVAT